MSFSPGKARLFRMVVFNYEPRRGKDKRVVIYLILVACTVVALCAALPRIKAVLARGIDAILTWSARDYDSDGKARKWLDDSFVNEWLLNPFPSQCVDNVVGMSDRSNEADYWLRIQFKPQCAETIMRNIRDDLRSDNINPITLMTAPRAPASARADPSFWKPEEVEDPITFEVCRHGSDPRIIGRKIIISISKKKGIAYVRLIQF
jgi:hypothetical protein